MGYPGDMRIRMRIFLFKNFISAAIFALLCLGNIADCDAKAATALINGKEYIFEVADTEESRRRGLMGRKELGEDAGMLFIFEEERYLTFYMKDTSIPLDIAFIDSDYRVVDMRSMAPMDERLVRSGKEAKFSLEANRGFFGRAGLKVGGRFRFHLSD